MASGESGFGKRFQVIILVIAVIALVLPLAHLLKWWTHDGKDGEPGPRRFDRITFTNASDEEATNVRIQLYEATGSPPTMWWDCPLEGYLLGKVDPGQTVTWVFNHEEELETDAVIKVVCEMEYQDPTMNPPKAVVATCEITAYPNYVFNSATFWFGHPHEAGRVGVPEPPIPERELCGEAVMSYRLSASPTPNVLPHTSSQQAVKP